MAGIWTGPRGKGGSAAGSGGYGDGPEDPFESSEMGTHELAEHEAELEAIFHSSPVIQLLVTGDGLVRLANRAAREYFDLRDDELRGKRAGDLIGCLSSLTSPEGCGHGDDCSTCRMRLAVQESIQKASVHRRLEVTKTLMRDKKPYEATLLVSTSAVRIGGRAMVLLCLEDITAARRAEERLREQAALLAAAHDAICVLDLEGRVRFWNRGAERLYGWESREVLGEDAAKVIFGGSRIQWTRLRQLAQEEGHWEGELQQVRRDGQPITVEARASLVRDHRGSASSVLLVATDVTEQRQLERQVFRGQRLESLGTLVCGIAHDLNNVLTPVQMVADLLRASVAGSEAERFLDLLSRSTNRGADIIRQLLLFGRGMEGARDQMDVRFLLKETVTILRETFPKSIQVRLEVAENLWPVIGDATQLHQVILNLCVNARDAMPRGGTLTLAVENVVLDEESVRGMPEARPGRYVAIQVADTGTGIVPEVFDRIFDPFFTTKPQGQGSGLGLSTVQGIVRSHKGFVRVSTKLGVGSTFRIHIPAGTEGTGESRSVIPPSAHPGGREWILVADDEEAIRELIKATLERAGYQVITAADGAEAISMFGRRHTEIAAVIIDMMMPLIDGPTAIPMFRRLNPYVPILAVSGLPAQREEAESASGGRIGFLQKPFQMKDLMFELARCIQMAAPVTRRDAG
jgi:PAS domain S-box-containing protein